MPPLSRLIPLFLVVVAAFLALAGESYGATCPAGQFSADYYGNKSLSGSPVLARCETKIENTWVYGSPDSRVPVDNFSVRWVGSFDFSAGEYEFTATVDDGVRVFVDGVKVLESWVDQPATLYKGKRMLSNGRHEVKVEYYESVGAATAILNWTKTASASSPPPSSGCSAGQFSASYFGNTSLSGSAVLSRCESAIANTWGYGSPGSGVPTDNFSARWVGSFAFVAGEFEFTAKVDDGIRVFVDGVKVIESWTEQSETTYKTKRVLTAGNHEVKVEYYEKAGAAVATVGWAKTSGGTGSSDTTAPSTPSGLSVSNVSGSGLTLSWSASSDAVGVIGYDAYRDGTKVGTATSTSYPFSGLACGTSYTLGVQARDAAGNLSTRATASAKTAACASSPPPSSGGASLYVSPNGSDSGSCTQAAPCASFHRAYQVAQPGAVVQVAGGTYPSQTINNVSGKTGPNVVFQPATGSRVILGGLEFEGPDFITVRGMETTYVNLGTSSRNQRGIWVGPGSTSITLENMDAGSVDSWKADRLTVLGGDFGPCNAVANNVCGNNKQDVSTNVLIDGATFHDLNYDPSNIGAHWECMYLNGGRNVTIRNSRFRGCAIFDIFATISGSEAAAMGHENLTIENNWFEKPWTENGQTANALALAWCANAASQPAYRNVKVRFNSFQDGAGIPTDNASTAGCQFQNVTVTGNIAEAMGCTNGWTYAYNVWSGSARCATTDTNIQSPPYVNGGNGSSGNYHLTGGTPVDFVPSSVGCPGSDIDRQARPSGARCDAGSDER